MEKQEKAPLRSMMISSLHKIGINELIFALQDIVDEMHAKESSKTDNEPFVWTEPEAPEEQEQEPAEEGPEFIYRN